MFNFKTLAFAGFAFILGIIGLSMVFSNLGPSESLAGRIATAVIFFSLCGLATGYFNPRVWILSALVTWGSTLFGLSLVYIAISKHGRNGFVAQKPPYISAGLITTLLPLSLSLIGGYIGKRLKNSRRV